MTAVIMKIVAFYKIQYVFYDSVILYTTRQLLYLIFLHTDPVLKVDLSIDLKAPTSGAADLHTNYFCV